MRHHKAKDWELRLKVLFDKIDAQLEDEYAGRFKRHPSRPQRGVTSNPEMDGLFNVGASYSAGFGSRLGPGYVVDIRISTLQHVSKKIKLELRDRVEALLSQELANAFPGKNLQVNKERKHLRITGDLSLD
ncbi:hypothetical protein P4B35_00495 [Pontiellaceae bacterium B12227]|nr:hypothetical protein [Pontiellaceae bacterium B12227]